MKHVMALVFGLEFLTAVHAASAAAETNIQGGVDHPMLSRMPDIYITSYTSVEYGSYKFIEQVKKTPVIEGRKTYIEYRLNKDASVPGELKIRRAIQEALKKIGGKVVFDDNFNRCSTIVTEKDGLETWVEVRSFDRMYRLNIVERTTVDLEVPADPGGLDCRLDTALKPDAVKHHPEIPLVSQNMWPQWADEAKKAVRSGLPLWVGLLRFNDGIVNGARVRGGSLKGPPLLSFVYLNMKNGGVPDSIVKGFMEPVSEAFSFWANSVNAQDLPWYPSFEMYPGPVAPPTLNVEYPLSAMTQSPFFLDTLYLASTIMMRIGGEASSPEAKAAIDDFCTWLNAGFELWQASATIKEAIGTGPVPIFNPGANIFSSSVINGTANEGRIYPPPSFQ